METENTKEEIQRRLNDVVSQQERIYRLVILTVVCILAVAIVFSLTN